MKKRNLVIGIILLALVFSACSQKTVETTKLEDAAKVLTEVKTTQFFYR